MVPPSSRKVPRVSRYSGSCSLRSDFTYEAFTLSGGLSQNPSAILPLAFCSPYPMEYSMVWALPISLAATLGIDVSFSSSPYLDVSVQAVPLHGLCIGPWMPEVSSGGFPHSDTPGSLPMCGSPGLFAAYHVLLRLLVPRHPPCALCCLIS